MSYFTDGVLGVLSLAVFAGALLAVDASLSVPFLVLGVAGTVAFEVVAFRNSETVRSYWERPLVQLGTLVSGFAIAGFGVVVAASSVLSAGIGALAAYLVILFAVVVRS